MKDGPRGENTRENGEKGVSIRNVREGSWFKGGSQPIIQPPQILSLIGLLVRWVGYSIRYSNPARVVHVQVYQRDRVRDN